MNNESMPSKTLGDTPDDSWANMTPEETPDDVPPMPPLPDANADLGDAHIGLDGTIYRKGEAAPEDAIPMPEPKTSSAETQE